MTLDVFQAEATTLNTTPEILALPTGSSLFSVGYSAGISGSTAVSVGGPADFATTVLNWVNVL